MWTGDDLAAFFVYRHPFDEGYLVGYFADTGIRGARLGYTAGTFISGAGFPDYAIIDSKVLHDVDAGVKAAGWFDHNWQLQD